MEIRSTVHNPAVLGDVVRQARTSTGLTQQALADKLEVPRQLIWNLENGKPTKALERLFAVLGETGVVLQATFTDDALFDGEITP